MTYRDSLPASTPVLATEKYLVSQDSPGTACISHGEVRSDPGLPVLATVKYVVSRDSPRTACISHGEVL